LILPNHIDFEKLNSIYARRLDWRTNVPINNHVWRRENKVHHWLWVDWHIWFRQGLSVFLNWEKIKNG